MSNGTLPGAPRGNFGSVIATAPKHRASHPMSITLRVIDDIVPLQLLERGAMREVDARVARGYEPPRQSFGNHTPTHEVRERRACGKGMPERVDHGSYIIYRNRKVASVVPRVEQTSKTRVVRGKSERTAMDDMCRSLIRAAGFDGTITRMMMRAARDTIAQNAQIMDYVGSVA